MNHATRRRINAIARDQLGHITVWQAQSAGLSSDALTNAVRRGELARVRPRVYRFPALRPTWQAELMADVLCVPRDAWASHSSALRLHGTRSDRVPRAREILVIGRGAVAVDPRTTVHRTLRLTDEDRCIVDGIPATQIGRTLVDVASMVDRTTMLEVLDAALCEHPSSRPAVHEAATRLSLGRRNCRALAAATGPDAEGEFWSWLERNAAPLVSTAGVYDAVWNQPVEGAQGVGIADTYSAAFRLIIEWKGLAFHRRPRQLQRDSDKLNAAARAGLSVVTFTWSDVVRRPEYVVHTLRAMLHRSAA